MLVIQNPSARLKATEMVSISNTCTNPLAVAPVLRKRPRPTEIAMAALPMIARSVPPLKTQTSGKPTHWKLAIDGTKAVLTPTMTMATVTKTSARGVARCERAPSASQAIANTAFEANAPMSDVGP